MNRFLRAEGVTFLLLWLLLIIFGRVLLFRDPGTFWHIVVGQHLFSSHHFPTRDIYSFTFQGQPWIAQQWLLEGLMALIYGWAGFDGLLFVTAAALAGLYAWLLGRLRRGGLSLPLAALVVALALAAGSNHFHVRPHILSIVFLALTFAWLGDFEAGRRSLRQLFWLWPLFLIWTNSHGAVLGGIGTLGLAVGGWTLAPLLGLDSPLKNRRDFLLLSALLLGCILTIFLSPYGLALPKDWFVVVRSPVIPQVIQEHVSLFRDFGKGWPIVLFGLFFLACLLGTLPARPRVTWLLPLVWLALACARVRNGPLFAVTAALALAEFYPRVRWARSLGDRGSVIFRQTAPPLPVPLQSWLLPGAVVLLTAVVSLGSLGLTGHGLTRLDPRHWPLGMLPELRQYEQEHPDAPIINDMLYGGFLIFYTPRLRIFIDDRCDLYSDQFLFDYARNDQTFLAGWLKRSGARIALAETGLDLDHFFKHQPGWHLVKRTAAAALYLRSGASN